MLNFIKSRIQAFTQREDGSLSVEAVLVFPILLWAYAAMFIYWDAFKSQNINLKATYTIADMISREDQPIDNAYMDGMNTVYEYLIRSDLGNDIRVTVVGMGLEDDGVTPEHECRWSYATGDMQPYTDLNGIIEHLPLMAVGDELIVVQSQMDWEPPINFTLEEVGLGATEFTNLVFTSPRFVPQVLHATMTSC